MKLTELEPRWLTENVFIFRCPHCIKAGGERRFWLSCKNVPMSIGDQIDLFASAGLPHGDATVVPMRAETCWNIQGRDFATMSITPSIDASPSGDWHGHITNGEIVGGI